ncbi:MAG: FAD-dependent 5-carboxymethylaminomethyl-2-thiouridine(34) oxidoreductase MnmC [Porticoccaceae bacterium]
MVIGSGIAGCASAFALARRNWRVTLIDRHPHVAAEASGNPQGVLYPRLSVEDQALSLFARSALCHALAFYQPLWAGHGERCGVLVLPESDREREQFLRIAERYREARELVSLVTGDQMAAIAGLGLDAQLGLFYPGLGWVAPPSVCTTLAAGCELIQGNARELHYDGEREQWHIVDGRGGTLASAPVVILANAAGTARFAQTDHLPLRQIRGQISTFPANGQSLKLSTVICGAGYLVPSRDGFHSLGATYDLDDRDVRTRDEDHSRNLATLAATDRTLGKLFAPPALDGRAALRCTTPDYLPIAGPAPRLATFTEDYQALRRNARADIPLAGTCWPGLWLNCGHGSRGLTYAPLAAELIASLINGEPSPLPRELATALHPGRFIIRDLKRNRPAAAGG